MNTENITRVRRLDLNTVLYSGSAYQSQGSSAAGHWINTCTALILVNYNQVEEPQCYNITCYFANVQKKTGSLYVIQLVVVLCMNFNYSPAWKAGTPLT